MFLQSSYHAWSMRMPCAKLPKGMVVYSAVSSPLDRSRRFALSSPGRPVHSNTNSASLGSILAMQQLRNDYSLTFPPLSIRNGSIGGFEPGLSRLRVRHSTTELPRSTGSMVYYQVCWHIIVQMPLHCFLSGYQQWLVVVSNHVSIVYQNHHSLVCNLPPNAFGYLTQLHRLQ